MPLTGDAIGRQHMEYPRTFYTDLDTSFCKEIGEGHEKAASTIDVSATERDTTGARWPSRSATNPL
jgi:hypothetical protein